jgi:phosphoglycolate phosphatase
LSARESASIGRGPPRKDRALSLIIFDVDGTLIDSQDLLHRVHVMAFREHGLEPPEREAILRLVGISLSPMMQALAGPAAPVDSLVESYKRHFNAEVARDGFLEPLYPGAAEALQRLANRPGTLLGIATGKSRRGIDRLLDHFYWRDLFATIQTADDAPSKPHPGMVLQAIDEAGATPADTVLVGDTSYDMEMACAAGARAIGVAWGYHPPEALLRAGATQVIGHFDELDP